MTDGTFGGEMTSEEEPFINQIAWMPPSTEEHFAHHIERRKRLLQGDHVGPIHRQKHDNGGTTLWFKSWGPVSDLLASDKFFALGSLLVRASEGEFIVCRLERGGYSVMVAGPFKERKDADAYVEANQ